MKCLIVSILLLCAFHAANAQKDCGTDIMKEKVLEQYTGLRSFVAQCRRNLNAARLDTSAFTEVIRVPVVVHVLYRNSAGKISRQQIESQFTAVNRDFNGLNPDIKNVPVMFSPKVNRTNWIEFFIDSIKYVRTTNARFIPIRDPNVQKGYKDPVKDSALGGSGIIKPGICLNIWVAENINFFNAKMQLEKVVGYALFPETPFLEYDGVVVDRRSFGTIGDLAFGTRKGRTLTHELGHWLGLRHLWGDREGECNIDGDNIRDTPPQKKRNRGCPAKPRYSCLSDTCDMYMNFMDYVNDDCMYMFTREQVLLMKSMFRPGKPRYTYATNIEEIALPRPDVADTAALPGEELLHMHYDELKQMDNVYKTVPLGDAAMQFQIEATNISTGQKMIYTKESDDLTFLKPRNNDVIMATVTPLLPDNTPGIKRAPVLIVK